jgi:hypothetical protein
MTGNDQRPSGMEAKVHNGLQCWRRKIRQLARGNKAKKDVKQTRVKQALGAYSHSDTAMQPYLNKIPIRYFSPTMGSSHSCHIIISDYKN